MAHKFYIIINLLALYCFQMSGGGNFSVAMNAGQQQMQPPFDEAQQ